MNGDFIKQTILVTGAAGMIGLATVRRLLDSGYSVIGIDRQEMEPISENYIHYVADLSDKNKIKKIVVENKVDRIIHLAALAHSVNGKKHTWNDYYHLNVLCAKNIFQAAGDIPVLFISTVDVYGFTKGLANINTPVRPVSHYAKSKVLAEEECKKLLRYGIFRFSPVYTETEKRDIQKRYYLKFPTIAYRIGSGTEYEILNVTRAAEAIVSWCANEPKNDIRIIKDPNTMNTIDCINFEKKEGRASIVLWFPQWLVRFGYIILKTFTGENKYTYLLNKAVFPLRTE